MVVLDGGCNLISLNDDALLLRRLYLGAKAKRLSTRLLLLLTTTLHFIIDIEPNNDDDDEIPRNVQQAVTNNKCSNVLGNNL